MITTALLVYMAIMMIPILLMIFWNNEK